MVLVTILTKDPTAERLNPAKQTLSVDKLEKNYLIKFSFESLEFTASLDFLALPYHNPELWNKKVYTFISESHLKIGFPIRITLLRIVRHFIARIAL